MFGAVCAACAASGPPPASTPASRAVSASSSAPTAAAGDVVLAIDDSRHFRIQQLATGAVVHTLSFAAIPGGPSLIAAAPHGWVVTYTPDPVPTWGGASARLALVDTSGTVTTFGPTFTPDRPVTGLAVSPDGTQVVLALMQAFAGGPPAELMLLAMPGHQSATRRWTLDDPDRDMGGQCEPDGATWIPASGAFAIVRDCPPNGTYTVVDADTGAPVGAPVTLPSYACLAADLHPSFDGRKMLISRCDRVELVSDEGVSELDSHLTDVAFPGA